MQQCEQRHEACKNCVDYICSLAAVNHQQYSYYRNQIGKACISTFAAVMKKKSHLPFFGIGPLYVALIVGLTVLGMVLSAKGYMDSGIIAGLKVPMIVLGVLVGVLGLFIWLYALFVSRILQELSN